MSISLVVLQGPSASGKSTIQSRLGLPRIVTWTSRAPREGESEGVDYFFRSRAEMERLYEQGQMVEMTEYHGNLYGTPLQLVEDVVGGSRPRSVILDRAGAGKLRELYRERTLLIGVKSDKEDCRRRLESRGHDPSEIAARLGSFEAEVAALSECDLILNNTDGNLEKIDLLADFIREGLKTRDDASL
ncbi:guanylate kinase [Cohnella hongkongensis]|uniref:Guanylate kinase n=1 Tax=Cohnella hongkongensis TaxID=178337 RepID=A0ABV9FDQ0_9BACL